MCSARREMATVIAMSVLFLVSVAGTVLATDHEGTIAADETWLAADNPHVVVNNVTVPAGVTLTIEAGAEVYLNASKRISIQGSLSAVGTAGQEILFTRNTASDWQYLYFQTGGSGTLEHCIVEYGTYAVYANSTGAIFMDHLTFRDNNYGINSIATNALTVTNCQFENNSYGLKTGGGFLDLGSSTFTGNTTYGAYCDGVEPNVLDANLVFTDNAIGFRVDDVAGLNLTTAMTVTGTTTTGIHLDNCDGATIDNQTLTDNTGTNGALFIDDCGDFTLGAGNTIGGAGQANSWGLTIGAGTFPTGGSVIPTSGNTINDIQVNGGSSDKTGTWRKFSDLDYIVTTSSTIQAGGELIIEPAVNVRLAASKRLTFQGTLTAVGAPGQEILFTRSGTGDWQYLYFQTAGAGTLEHCILEHGTYAVYGNSTGAISLANTTFRDNNYGINSIATNALTVTNCQFENNSYGLKTGGGFLDLGSSTFTGNTTYGAYCDGVEPNVLDANLVFTDNAIGFRVDDVAGLNLTTAMTVTGTTTTGIHLDNCDGATIDNQTLTDNTGTNGALFIDDCGDFTLGAGNTIGGAGQANSWGLTIGAGTFPTGGSVIPTSGNTINDIQVNGGSSDKTGTWRKFSDLDYIVTTSSTIQAGGELIIEPSVNVRLAASKRLTFQGTLTAVGAPGQEILFTRSGTGDWQYLYFQTAGAGTLEHCILEHGTYAVYGNSTGAISLANTTFRDNNYGINSIATNALTVTNCQFENNSYGLKTGGGFLDLGSSTFTGNTTYGAYCDGVEPNVLDANLVFTDNAIGFRVDDVAGLNLTTAMTVTGTTTTGIHLDNCDGATIDNQTLTDNTGTNGALFIDDCGDFTLGAGNTIGGAGQANSWGLTIGAGTFPTGGSVIPTSGNTINDIQVNGGSTDKTGAWREFTDLDYIVTNTPTIQAGGELIIEPSVNVRMATSTRLTIQGTLTVTGTPGQEVLFTSSGGGDWQYLYFQTAGAGTLEHCIIENATYAVYANSTGAISLSGATIRDANYGINSIASNTIELTGCLLENNNYGIRANSGTLTFLNSRIINNAEYGIYLGGATPVFGNNLTEWNDIYGNGSGNEGRDLRNWETDIDARFVHWGTMDYQQIIWQTWDLHDDFDLGYIQCLPFVNAAHDGETTDADDPLQGRPVPVAFGLHQNAPNPFNPSTVIRFDLAGTSPVRLKIFDVAGALVTTLLDEQLPAGYHEAAWSGRDARGRAVPSGVYFYRITAGDNIETKRMLLVK